MVGMLNVPQIHSTELADFAENRKNLHTVVKLAVMRKRFETVFFPLHNTLFMSLSNKAKSEKDYTSDCAVVYY